LNVEIRVFMEAAQEPLCLDKPSMLQWNITDLDTSCISIIILFDEAFKYGDYAKFWVHVWTNANPLCTEFCSFVRCQNFVNYFFIEYDTNVLQLESLIPISFIKCVLNINDADMATEERLEVMYKLIHI
jgi:hypothetical protein